MNPDHPIDGDLTPSAEKTFSESDPECVVPKFWGFWGTVGWTLLALLAGFLVQTFTAIVVAVVRMRTEAGFKPESLVTDGLLLAIATLAQTPVVLGMIVLAIWIRRRRIVDTLALKRPSPAPGRSLGWASFDVPGGERLAHLRARQADRADADDRCLSKHEVSGFSVHRGRVRRADG